MDRSAAEFFEVTQQLKAQTLDKDRERLDHFLKGQANNDTKVALVTSGGTTVPLELNTVRFIDNFSSGTRGALCTEELLRSGYAVVFLHRKGSNFPFLTDLVKQVQDTPTELIHERYTDRPTPSNSLPSDWGSRFLAVSFTTVFDYLFLLRECCQSIATVGPRALVMLAAAVSDFYVPENEMSAEKIQSRAHDGLTIQLRNVPKLLGATRLWAPEAFILSFKLETNANILLAKAATSLDKYGMDAVCSNQLQTIRDEVNIVEPDPTDEAGIKVAETDLTGNESEAVPVSGVKLKKLVRGDSAFIEKPLMKEIMRLHSTKLSSGQPSKRQRL
jgi:phosphopantothenate---cysteine ligase (ATP)